MTKIKGFRMSDDTISKLQALSKFYMTSDADIVNRMIATHYDEIFNSENEEVNRLVSLFQDCAQAISSLLDRNTQVKIAPSGIATDVTTK